MSSRAAGAPAARLGLLDLLRLVAALMVVSWHFVAQGDYPWERPSQDIFGVADQITSYGWLGVELFFVISGFVICMSAWGRSLGEYIISRAVRLYPAYWFAIGLITLAVTIWPVLQQRMISSEIMINLTMLQYPVGVPGVSAVFWTLWQELHFYLLFAIVVWRGVTYRRVVAFSGLWTVASVFATNVHNPVLSTLVEEQYSPYFIGGIVLYLMYRHRPTAVLWGMLGVSYALAMVKSVTATKAAKSFVGHPVSWKGTAGVVTFAFVAVALVTLWPRLSRVRWRWLTVAGALTYPLYLMHLELGWLAIRLLHRSVPTWPLLIAVTVALLLLSYAVHRFVERPVAPRMRRLLRAGLADIRNPAAAERHPRVPSAPAAPAPAAAAPAAAAAGADGGVWAAADAVDGRVAPGPAREPVLVPAQGAGGSAADLGRG